MEAYSITEAAKIAGISTRTLRYYHEIGLLKPCATNLAGYRFYGEKEMELLQQILFYRERGLGLEEIRKILYDRNFQVMEAMEEHLHELEKQEERIQALIRTVKRTISAMKGECEMSTREKFEVFKQQMVEENERRYGKEVRDKYGDEAVEAVNKKILNMTEEEYERFQNLGEEIRTMLEEAVTQGRAPQGEWGRRIVRLHKEWLSKTWKVYRAEAHKAIANTYISDERFRIYYDRRVAGCAAFLEAAIVYWVDK